MEANDIIIFSNSYSSDFNEDDTIINDCYPKKIYDPNAGLCYSKPMYKMQKNVISTIQFLTEKFHIINSSSITLVIVALDWDNYTVNLILELFPQLEGIDIWSTVPSKYTKSEKVTVKRGFPGDKSYTDTNKNYILVVDLVSSSAVYDDRDLYTQRDILYKKYHQYLHV